MVSRGSYKKKKELLYIFQNIFPFLCCKYSSYYKGNLHFLFRDLLVQTTDIQTMATRRIGGLTTGQKLTALICDRRRTRLGTQYGQTFL